MENFQQYLFSATPVIISTVASANILVFGANVVSVRNKVKGFHVHTIKGYPRVAAWFNLLLT